PDDRIELARPGLAGQVAAVLLEGLIGALGVGAGHPLAAANGLERAQHRLAAGTVALEQLLALAPGLGRAQQQVLGRRVLVAEAPGLLLRPLDDPLGARVEAERSALDVGASREQRRELAAEAGEVDAEAPERLGGDAVVRLDQG